MSEAPLGAPGQLKGSVMEPHNEDRALVDLVAGGHAVAMVTTMIGDQHSARPVTCLEVIGDRMSFLVSRSSDWATAIADSKAAVLVTVADDRDNVYVSLNGDASVVSDVAEQTRIWNPVAKAWFSGPDDPDLAILHFDIVNGEYWKGPESMLGRVVAMMRAASTGSDVPLGDTGRVV